MYAIRFLDSPIGAHPQGDHGFALNNKGHVAGFAYVGMGRGILWRPDPLVLPLVGQGNPRQASMAIGLNDSDDLVGTFERDIFPGQAFLYRDGAMVDLSNLFNAEQSFARAINNSGLILATAGEISPGPPQEHFLWNSRTGDAPTSVGVGGLSAANVINSKGQLVGVVRGDDESRGILVDGSERMDLGPGTSPLDLNDAGQVVGSRVAEGASLPTAFLCGTSTGTPQFEDLGTLPLPGPVRSAASGINNSGDIVGNCITELPGGVRLGRSFVRLAGGAMLDLNSLIPPGTGVLLDDGPRINDKGQISGRCDYAGEQRAYLLTPEIGNRKSDEYKPAVHILAGLIGSGWELTYIPRGAPVRPDPIVQWATQLSPEKRDMLAGVAISELAALAHDVRSRREIEQGALHMIRRALDKLTRTDRSNE